MPGYSGKPVAQKLGLKAGLRVHTLGAPADYLALLEEPPAGLELREDLEPGSAFIHLFARDRAEAEAGLARARAALAAEGTLWVSWPKKSSPFFKDLTEDGIRALALPLGLVDLKVCAVSGTWSGLKLMVRKELR